MSGLFGRQKPADPVRMPDQNDEVARETRRRTQQQLRSRQGRSSTNLEGSTGQPYRASLLGNAG